MSLFIQLIIISISLALDALSVSVAGGIQTKKAKLKDALKVATYFGGFQAGMPLIGWVIGVKLQSFISSFDHWIAFILLAGIGLKMIKDAMQAKDENEKMQILNNRVLFLLAIATSIDALIVGITLGFIKIPLLLSVACIGLITFILSLFGFLFGKKLGSFFEGKIEMIGGLALIGIGLKILLEHLRG